jgi:LPXTG-motif cell wall-anchored protein
MLETNRSVLLRAVLTSALAVLLIAVLGGAATAQDSWTISDEGVGPVTLGSTIDEVRGALPDSYVLGDEVPIAPDLDGYVVSLDGTVHLLIPATDDGTIETIIVLDESYQTTEGIGPRSLIGDAEDIYGDVRLEWSADDQGRERVLFDDNPVGLSFRASEAVGPQAGIYGDDQTSTVLYDPSSRLTSVWVVTVDDDATPAPVEEEPAEEEPATEVEEEPEPEEEPAIEEEAEPEEPEPEEDDNGTLPNIDERLPETGVESATVALAGASMLFIGFGIGRIGRRKRPWS